MKNFLVKIEFLKILKSLKTEACGMVCGIRYLNTAKCGMVSKNSKYQHVDVHFISFLYKLSIKTQFINF